MNQQTIRLSQTDAGQAHTRRVPSRRVVHIKTKTKKKKKKLNYTMADFSGAAKDKSPQSVVYRQEYVGLFLNFCTSSLSVDTIN